MLASLLGALALLGAGSLLEARQDSRPAEEAAAEARRAKSHRLLDELRTLSELGDVQEVRHRLAMLVEGPFREALAEMEEEDAIRACSEAARIAESVGALDSVGTIELETVRLLEANHEPDEPVLLAARSNLAATLARQGNLRGAHAIFESVHEAWERAVPADHPELLSARSNLGVSRHSMGDLRGAYELFEHVHSVREQQLPLDHPELLSAKSRLAAIRARLGELAEANELFEEIHAALEAKLAPGDPNLLSVKTNLAATRSALGDLPGARELEEHVHAAWERLLPADHPSLLRAKANLAGTLADMGELDAAHELFVTVYDFWSHLLPPEHPELLSVTSGLATVRRMRGDLRGALELDEHVHAVLIRQLPPDHPDLIEAKGNLAVTRGEMNNLAGAFVLEEEVHAALERQLPPGHPKLATAKTNLAVTRKALGDLEGAHELFEAVHAVRERDLPSDHRDLLRAKANLATTRKARGDLAGAIVLEEHVHAVWDAKLDPDHADLLAAKANLAVTRQLLGDHDGALELQEEVLAALARNRQPGDRDLLVAKANLALTRRTLGDLEGARELQEEVYASWSQLPAGHPDLVAAAANLAATRKLLGDFEGAAILEEHVEEAWGSLLPPDHPRLLTARTNLAVTRMVLDDREGALELVADILDGVRLRGSRLGLDSPRVARSGARAELVRIYNCLYLADAGAGAAMDASLFSALESLRAASVASSGTMRAAVDRPELGELCEELRRLRGNLGDLAGQPVTAGLDVEDWRAAFVELAEERDTLERKLRASLSEAELDGGITTVSSVAEGLGKDTVLLSFLRYPRGAVPDPETGASTEPVPSIVAFVVLPDARVRRVELGPAADIERLVAEWRAAVGAPLDPDSRRPLSSDEAGDLRGVGVGRSPGGERAVGGELATLLLEPCLSVLDGRPERIHVVLDDFLHLLPLEALPWGTDSDDTCVGDSMTVQVESSARRLGRVPRAHRPDGRGTLLAIGGVAFEDEARVGGALPATSDRTDGVDRPVTFPSLENTEPEVRRIAELYEEVSKAEARVLTGEDASKRGLLERVRGVRFLHVATHGWFERGSVPTDDVLERDRQAPAPWLFPVASAVGALAPEALCGLAFAGANHGRDSLGRVPGILTAEELAGIDLSACELAVLSACETNVGIRRAGQGIQSLQTALHAAGARTAITSLWKVDDAATRKLMERFYTYLWVDELGKADALWKAKCDLRAEGHPVRDWAAWVLSGEPE